MAWAYTALIFLLVTLPLNGKDQVFGTLNNNYVLSIRFDYFFHALLFIPWVVLGGYAYGVARKSPVNVWTWGVGAGLFAVACEYIQWILPYRTFNINDLVANSLGVVVGTGLYALMVRFEKRVVKTFFR
ncbi:hypothetical protein GCM10027275_13300 [Rhabdobacter roseus]|uniref:Glycopeptide antibiotics resistance protein n=1 Tax=Rhabdobacter roseus TaxID=1655419 RepID=A0A840TGF7_9BACT|nr:VanZ family protein [Rhabdobacter roseus]MBB5283246.1 glycopeptide antibiotics resistance protein [Rhabdobacter roseus]